MNGDARAWAAAVVAHPVVGRGCAASNWANSRSSASQIADVAQFAHALLSGVEELVDPAGEIGTADAAPLTRRSVSWV
jgi:hypothetical protein